MMIPQAILFIRSIHALIEITEQYSFMIHTVTYRVNSLLHYIIISWLHLCMNKHLYSLQMEVKVLISVINDEAEWLIDTIDPLTEIDKHDSFMSLTVPSTNNSLFCLWLFNTLANE